VINPPGKDTTSMGDFVTSSRANPYLTIESELLRIYEDKIRKFWESGESGEFISPRGRSVRIRFKQFVHDNLETAIVIASGRAECLIKYKELTYDLFNNGFSVFIHDHRGQGLSSRLLTDQTKQQLGYVEDFEDYVIDLKEFVERQVKPTRHDRYVLLGHSMGGCIASLYLQEYQWDFERAVLSSPMHQPNLGHFDDAIYEFIKVLGKLGRDDDYAPKRGPYDLHERFEGNALTHSRTRWEITRNEYISNQEVCIGGPSVRWVRLAYAAGQRARERAGQIKVPILLLQGGADTIVDAKGQNEFCSNLNSTSPDACRPVFIKDARHELFVEADEYRQIALGEETMSFINGHS